MTKTIDELIDNSSIGWAIKQLQKERNEELLRSKDCTCSPEHTIAKLGHCVSCPWSGTVLVKYPTELSRFGCPPRHSDGTHHDFTWAHYEDDEQMTGVCSCGFREIDLAQWEIPF